MLHTRTLQPVSGSDIDLQLRCSYQPEQGSTRIERVLASGTGAKIVTSHDDVCLIELHVAAQHDFKLAQKELDLVLKRAQIKPLAVGIHPDRNRIQLCYTSEVVNSALATLQARRCRVNCTCAKGWRWWRWSAPGYARTRCTATVSISN